MRLRYFVCLFGIGLAMSANAQTVHSRVRTTLDSSSIKVGAPVHLRFEIETNAGEKVVVPLLTDSSVKGIDIIQRLKADSVTKSKTVFNMLVTSFDSGTHVFPALPFVISNGSGRNDTVYSDSLRIEVSLIPTQGDKIADIKGPEKMPFSFSEVIPYIIGVLIGIAIIACLLWIYLRWKNKKPLLPSFSKPELPHVRALRLLNDLQSQKLWQKGQVKEYHSQLSDILRTYLEERFDLQTLEQTTSDVLYEISSRPDIRPYFDEIRFVLETADLAKFAKLTPDDSYNTRSYDNAVSFIERTIPSVEPEKNESEPEKQTPKK
jgi:hypothetical protein